jgi:Heavy metal binding domain
MYIPPFRMPEHSRWALWLSQRSYQQVGYNLVIQRRAFILASLFAASGIAPPIWAKSVPKRGPVQSTQDSQSSAVPPATAGPVAPPVEFVCPMHPDVRSLKPGVCPRCGMTLVANLPDRVEYPLEMVVDPSPPRAGKDVQFGFTVLEPKTRLRVNDFQVMHEKLYHLFIVSQDLQYFVHDHPEKDSDGTFRLHTVLPRPGMYRVLSDFYPTGGTPQLIVKTVVLPGAALAPGAELKPDLAPKDSANMRVSLTMQPAQPIAGMKTLMFFHLDPADGLEPYLGSWSHMLAASDDLVDMIHDHPFVADGGPQMQFNMIFPRSRTYRVWVQFQRKGVVNTAVFNIPVAELR